MLPKIKALLEGGQKLYTENATAQGRVFKFMDGLDTVPDKIRFKSNGNF